MQEIITVNNVYKKYRSQKEYAVSGVSFNVYEGEIIGILGPNGAGKSTMVKMILGVMKPSEGEIKVLGQDPMKFSYSQKRKIGVYLGGKSSLIYHLPVIDSVKMFKSIYKISTQEFNKNLQYYSHMLQCDSILNQRVATLSLGQKLRAELLCMLIYEPRLLILDEPTLGLDIDGKKQFRDILRSLVREKQLGVLITTHDVNDMEKLSSRILMIKQGEKILDLASDEFEDILKKYVILNSDCKLENNSEPHIKMIEYDGKIYRYLVKSNHIEEIKKIVMEKSCTTLQQVQPSLEDLFYEYYR